MVQDTELKCDYVIMHLRDKSTTHAWKDSYKVPLKKWKKNSKGKKKKVSGMDNSK